jgi:hypothetical protein
MNQRHAMHLDAMQRVCIVKITGEVSQTELPVVDRHRRKVGELS